MQVNASPFSFHGYDVQSLSLSPSASLSGARHGDTLAFPSFSGNVEITLKDGSFDIIPVDGGAILARWDPDNNNFVLALTISGTVQGVDFSLSGTVFGAFTNTSPAAAIVVPQATSQDVSHATVECAGPITPVVLDGSSSHDREDSTLRLAWYSGASPLASGSQLSEDLTLGVHPVTLMAYDSEGFAGQQNFSVSIVDTQGPQITGHGACLWPPNQRTACFSLQDLGVVATDACDGTQEAAEIESVTSSSVTGVVSWTSSQVCVLAERSGSETSGRQYSVNLTARDSSGNESTHALIISVPHSQSSGCE